MNSKDTIRVIVDIPADPHAYFKELAANEGVIYLRSGLVITDKVYDLCPTKLHKKCDLSRFHGHARAHWKRLKLPARRAL